MPKPTIAEATELERMRKALAPAAEGVAAIRVEAAAEAGATVALIHVSGAYDCKGTEAEIAGLLKQCPLPWRIVWH